MDVQSPKAPGRFGLRLDIEPPSQVLQTDGRLYHLAPAFLFVRGVTNSRAPWLHGRYPASSLLRTRPPPSGLGPISRALRLYGLPFSVDFSQGPGGLLQLLYVSLSPCCRFHPAQVACRFVQFRREPCCLGPTITGSALSSSQFRGYFAFTFVTAR